MHILKNLRAELASEPLGIYGFRILYSAGLYLEGKERPYKQSTVLEYFVDKEIYGY